MTIGRASLQAILVCCILSGDTFADEVIHLTNVPPSADQTQYVLDIPVREGIFRFTNFSLNTKKPDPIEQSILTERGHRYGDMLVELSGSFSNETQKNWLKVCFDVRMRHHSGRITIATLKFDEVKPGESRPVQKYLTTVKESIESYEIAFSAGEYPVEYQFRMLRPITSKHLSYEDHNIAALFLLDKNGIGVAIANKTLTPVKILWDDASVVDLSGLSRKVWHRGVKYIEKEKSQVPTIIAPGARVEEVIVPADNLELGESGWDLKPLLPNGPEAFKYKGSQFGVLLPLKLGNVRKNYMFVFRIDDVI